jgi:hypothetical protein
MAMKMKRMEKRSMFCMWEGKEEVRKMGRKK